MFDSADEVDVVIIGGGVNGTGVARDATIRGLRVALFERNDLAFGASGNSSGMIHGGPRYLIDNPEVTETSCRDSGHIQKIAPHLLFRIPFLMPVEDTKNAKSWLKSLSAEKGYLGLALMDGFFEAYDRFQPLKHGKKHTRLTPEELRQLEPGIVGNVVGGITFDEWGIDGSRLCAANALDAQERGALIYNGVTVDRISRPTDSNQVFHVYFHDRYNGQSGSIRTQIVVNATGAWAPITAMLGGLPNLSAPVRPGKGIHIVYDRRLTNYAITAKTIDDRQIFLEPWQNMSVLGTTDDDYYGDLDRVKATSEEVRYLTQAIARVFPDIETARIIGTFAGVRPTLYQYGPLEDKLSREHEVVDHAKHGVPGMYSMIGGKLASYRLFACEMTDILCQHFKKTSATCSTHILPLPGGDSLVDPFAFAKEHELDPVAARRMIFRHGSRVTHLQERMARNPTEAFPVCVCEPVLEAEVRYVVRHEFARTVADVARRTRLGLGSCGGMRCAMRCGQIVAEELGLTPQEGQKQALSFLLRQSETRVVGLGPDQARQESIAIAAIRSDLGVQRIEEDL